MVAFFAFHQFVGEPGGQMTGCLPNLWIHQDCRIQSDDVFMVFYHFIPPGFFNIIFHFNPQRSEIIGRAETAVNFRGRKNKPSSFGQRYDFLH